MEVLNLHKVESRICLRVNSDSMMQNQMFFKETDTVLLNESLLLIPALPYLSLLTPNKNLREYMKLGLGNIRY